MIKRMTERYKRLYLSELLLVALAALLLGLGYAYWYDEAFSINIVRSSFSQIIDFTASDVHPPFYYFFLKLCCIIFGYNRIGYHMASVLPFVVMLAVIGWFCRRHFGEKEALLTVLFCAGAPQMLNYAAEIRMYSLGAMFIVLAMALAIELYNEPTVKKWLLYAVVNALAAYTQYFAGAVVLLIAAVLMVFILVRREDRKKQVVSMILSLGVTGVLYLPWLFVFLRQFSGVRNDYWIERFRLDNLMEYLHFIFGEGNETLSLVLQVLFVAAVVSFLYFWKRDYKNRIFFLCGAVFFGYIAMGIGISVLITPVFVQRYIFYVLPLLWIVVVCAVCQWKKTWVYVFLGLAGIASFLITFQQQYENRIGSGNVSLMYVMQNELRDGDVIYSTSPYIMADMAVYFPEYPSYISEDDLADEAFRRWDEMAGCTIVPDAEDFCRDRNGKVWLLVYEDEHDTVRAFRQAGYMVAYKGKETIAWESRTNLNKEVAVYYCTLEGET